MFSCKTFGSDDGCVMKQNHQFPLGTLLLLYALAALGRYIALKVNMLTIFSALL